MNKTSKQRFLKVRMSTKKVGDILVVKVESSKSIVPTESSVVCSENVEEVCRDTTSAQVEKSRSIKLFS